MADTAAYPYETRLNILHGPLEVVDVKADGRCVPVQMVQPDAVPGERLGGAMGVFEGEYHWHKHDDDDEFFFTVEGTFLIDLEDRTVELRAGQGFVVPRKVVHRTRALERAVVLMVENVGIIPTGN